MEVDVDERWQRSRPQERATEVAERMGRRDRREQTLGRKPDACRLGRARPMRLPARRYVGRRARGVQSTYPSSAQASATSRSVYQPPPQKSVGSSPSSRIRRPSASTRSPGHAAGRPGMVGSRPMRVVTERSARCRLPRALEPRPLVLSSRSVGRAHQRGDREPSGPALLQSREARPDLVVEGSFDVAGDDRVPFPRRVRHQRTSIALRSGRPGRRRPHDRGARPSRSRLRRHHRARPLRPRPSPPPGRRPRDRRPAGARTSPVTSSAVFNGELYDFQDVRRDLARARPCGAGHR